MIRPAEPDLRPSGCDCDNCRGGDLPATPFLAPRVAHGMLLGEDDFRYLIGYPRGKHLLHQAWLHGAGVVWGYPVRLSGLNYLVIGPGLAIDPRGRDLENTATTPPVDLDRYVTEWTKEGRIPEPAGGCRPITVEAHVVAEFEGCLTDAVPAVADPCDVTRSHDEYSRVIERARVRVRYGPAPERLAGRHRRVRMLLGVLPIDDSDAGQQVRTARDAVLAAADRAVELERQVWLMACRDGLALGPAKEDWLPQPEEDAAVVLAGLRITLENVDDRWSFAEKPVVVDECVRTTLLPTDVLTSLAAALAPGLLGAAATAEEGPRVDPAGVIFEDGRRTLVIPVTADLVGGTVRGNVQITTHSGSGGDRWVDEDVYDAQYEPKRTAIVVRLAYSLDDRPAGTLVRMRVRGTGGKPVMGTDPLLPLAGVVGRPSGDPVAGADAVWTFLNEPGPAPAEKEASA